MQLSCSVIQQTLSVVHFPLSLTILQEWYTGTQKFSTYSLLTIRLEVRQMANCVKVRQISSRRKTVSDTYVRG